MKEGAEGERGTPTTTQTTEERSSRGKARGKSTTRGYSGIAGQAAVHRRRGRDRRGPAIPYSRLRNLESLRAKRKDRRDDKKKN